MWIVDVKNLNIKKRRISNQLPRKLTTAVLKLIVFLMVPIASHWKSTLYLLCITSIHLVTFTFSIQILPAFGISMLEFVHLMQRPK